MSSRGGEFLSGFRAELPIVLGVIPFGLIFGVLALSARIPPSIAMAMSSVVFAGSAQFLGAQLIATAAPALVIILSTLVINLRHVLYSASVAPYIKHLRAPWKVLLAYLLTDEAYAVTIVNYRRTGGIPNRYQHFYFLGAGLALWSGWQLSTAVGILLGAQIPPTWSLDFSVALTFIAIVIPALRNRADAAAACTAGITGLLAAGLPFKLGLVVAAAVGIGVGVWVGRHRPRQEEGAAYRELIE